MRKFFVTLMTSLLSCSAAFAFLPEAVESSLEIGVGYRWDSFKWTTSADPLSGSSSLSSTDPAIVGSSPVGVRSELKWKNLRIWQIEGRGKYVTCDNIYLRGYADYGWITHGRNTDVDFITDDEFSGSGSGDFVTGGGSEIASSHNRSRKGHVYDVSFGLGYQFKMCDDSFALAPLVGYSWHGQHLNINHGRQSFPYSGSIPHLHSRYKARWDGPWIGFDLDYKFCFCCSEWDVFASYEYHWAYYHASADWNLRSDLPSGFRHRAKRADGQIASVGAQWGFCDCWTVGILGQFQWWEARHGRDRALIAEGRAGDIREKCYLSIPLRRVRWDSASVSIELGMAF